MARPTVLTAPWSYLAARVGGVGALAALLGVSRRTIHRWATEGRVPSGAAQLGIRGAFVRRGIAPPTWSVEH
jgi:DNA-binding transcriptional regulator YdaS (Cro superfamily)